MNIHMRVPSGLQKLNYMKIKMKFVCLVILVMQFPFLGKAQKLVKNANNLYSVVEEMPKYPGGETALRTFLAENLKYPEEAKAKKLSGKVYVNFILDETGKVTNTKVVKGVDPLLDKEALRVINLLPQWKPGKDGGKAVKVSYTIPLKFSLD